MVVLYALTTRSVNGANQRKRCASTPDTPRPTTIWELGYLEKLDEAVAELREALRINRSTLAKKTFELNNELTVAGYRY